MDWSPRTAVRWLVAPSRGFAKRAPLRVGVAVVVVLCIVNVVFVSQAAVAVADATTGTTQVDNPARPSEWICEQAGDDEFYADYQSACANEPETVTREYASAARTAANGLTTVALLAPLALWLAAAGAFAVAMGGQGPDDPDDRVSYASVLAVVGIGLAPSVLRYAARTFLVERSLANRTLTPASLDDASRTAIDAMSPETVLYLVVVVATVAWSAYVWRAGLRAVFDRAGVAVDVAIAFVAVLLCVQAVNPVYVGSNAVLFGVVLLLFGLPALAFPRVLERIDLFFDLIGTRGDVELKPWRVFLEQVGGLALVLGAAVFLGVLLVA